VAASSAGVLLYRRTGDGGGDADDIEVLIGHMGGPFWARRDAGGWSIPKGEYQPAEDPLAAARREFAEELGQPVPAEAFAALGNVTASRGKTINVWAAEGDLDAQTAVSNTFSLEWPKGSGIIREFPELDRVAWIPLALARTRLVASQVPFLDRLVALLRAPNEM
jgi:predicted NUDIX family NTP pyrophosphohydrolase